jgi:hypothetical protein
LWSRHLRELLSYQNPHRSNQLWQGFVRVSYLVLEHIALGLGDSQDFQLFGVLSSAVVYAPAGNLQWSCLPKLTTLVFSHHSSPKKTSLFLPPLRATTPQP